MTDKNSEQDESRDAQGDDVERKSVEEWVEDPSVPDPDEIAEKLDEEDQEPSSAEEFLFNYPFCPDCDEAVNQGVALVGEFTCEETGDTHDAETAFRHNPEWALAKERERFDDE